MKSLQEYRNFYNDRLKPKLDDIEKQRTEIRSKRNRALISYFSIAAIIAIIIMSSTRSPFAIFIIFGLIIIGLMIVSSFSGNFNKIFKTEIINEVIKFFGEDLTYTPKEHITEREYKQSNLYGSYDRYNGEDLISGTIFVTDEDERNGNGINVRMSELHTEDRHTDSEGKTHYSTIFKGVFMIVDFNKSFKSSTYVLKDSGILNCIGGKSGTSRVKLEDVEFEKEFEVYSEDQIEARYILTPSFMEKLKGLKDKTKGEMRIAFRNNQMYLTIYTYDNLLEASLGQSLEKFEDLAVYYEQLNFYFSIIEDLSLNNNIWNKDY